MLKAREQAIELVQLEDWAGGLPDLALGFALRRSPPGGNLLPFNIPTVVGLSNLEEVHHALRVWHAVNRPELENNEERRVSLERRIIKHFVETGWSNWSWESGS